MRQPLPPFLNGERACASRVRRRSNPSRALCVFCVSQGDEEDTTPIYTYTGARAEGVVTSVTAGEEPKVLTQDVTLLGERAGAGEAVFPNGDKYSGEFAAGSRSGAGTYVYAASPPAEEGEEPKPPVATFNGKWKAGEKNGVGVMDFSSGAKYHGSFKAGALEGQGTMYYTNGDVYTGEWLAGKKSGSGTYIFKESGAKVQGTWEANQLLEGTFTDKFGNAFAGSFEGTTSSVSYAKGGTFTLASGATAVC